MLCLWKVCMSGCLGVYYLVRIVEEYYQIVKSQSYEDKVLWCDFVLSGHWMFFLSGAALIHKPIWYFFITINIIMLLLFCCCCRLHILTTVHFSHNILALLFIYHLYYLLAFTLDLKKEMEALLLTHGIAFTFIFLYCLDRCVEWLAL